MKRMNTIELSALANQDSKERSYWLEKLSGELPKSHFPYDYGENPEALKDSIGVKHFTLPHDTGVKLEKLCNGSYYRMHMALISIAAVLLNKFTGENDIFLGTPIFRQEQEDELTNAFLPLRIVFIEAATYKEVLINTRDTIKEAVWNQNYPVEKLLFEADFNSMGDDCNFFNTIVLLENIQDKEYISHIKYDTLFRFNKTDVCIEGKLEYNQYLYTERAIENIIERFITLTGLILDNTNSRISELELLSKVEREKILVEFNDTKTSYSREKTISELFEEQVQKTPDSIAVVHGESRLTYRELNEKANQLASTLREKGICKESIAGIMADRSPELLAGIIGVLKAGGAYLPIDPEYPADRIKYMLEDSKAKILLTHTKFGDKLDSSIEKLMLDEEDTYRGDINNPEPKSKPDNLAYIIYTSGSTGKPKGVQIEHRSLNNFIETVYERYDCGIGMGDNCLSLASISFDVSVEEIFLPLLKGATLVLYPSSNIIDIEQLKHEIIKNSITYTYIPPTILKDLNTALRSEKDKVKLNKILVGVEPIKDHVLEAYKELNRDMKIVDGYGPTETTIAATMYKYGDTKPVGRNVPIGKPMNNSGIYIIGKNNALQPIGIPGELYVEGDCVGRGYLNRPELTAEKFLENPFIKGERMYRTGDLARWLPDGNIEFLGRIDEQVKIRGYRIELGEIESRLIKHAHIKEAKVIAREDSNSKYLCAYIVSDKELTVSELRAYLSEELPYYMIPSYFMRLTEIPLNRNGKVDRKALPEPDGNIETGAEYEEPQSETEEKLVKIWQEILAVERIGINDSFFELGGNSLKATAMAARVHKDTNVGIHLKQIFAEPTIKALGVYINNQEQNKYQAIEKAEERESYPLSSAQKRMYILQQMEKNSTVYNIPMFFEIEGKLNREALENIFKKIIERHESLRTSFEIESTHAKQEEIVQKIHPETDFKVEYYVAESKEDIRKIAESFIRPFELKVPPLMRVGLIRVQPDKHILLLDMHHIISDGMSMGILIKEFSRLYKGEALPELKLQYKDYAVWQRNGLEKEVVKKQEEYWLSAFCGEIPVLNLPTDNKRPAIQSFEGDTIYFELDGEVTKGLRRIAKETGSTMYMVMLAGLNILLSGYSGQEDIIIGTPIAGRPHADLENIMGMFVNTLAMRNYPEGSKTVGEFIKEVKANALRAYENQNYQFEELVEKLNLRRDISRNPIFDVMFAMQNMDMEEIAIKGISIKRYDIEKRISKFDITIEAAEAEEKLDISIEYGTKLFNKETMERMAVHLINVLRDITRGMDKRISEIKLLGEEERYKLLNDFNSTNAEYPKNKTIHELFEEQVKKTPDNIAVAYEGKRLTYRELNSRANSLARTLAGKGVRKDAVIGILSERSVDMLVGIMAVLKAGGAYMPISPGYPDERIKYMLEDSGANIVLVQQQFTGRMEFGIEPICINDEEVYAADASNLSNTGSPDSLAYVIYTSGSTGKPKGVMIEHRSVINLVSGLNKEIYKRYDTNMRIALIAPYIFDASVKQIFAALLLGHSLYIVPEDARINGKLLTEYYMKNGIDISDGTPTHIKLLLNSMVSFENGINVRHFLIGGEALSYDTAKSFMEKFKGQKPYITNVYGPTECCVDSTAYLIDPYKVNAMNIVPIGKPISNTRLYILDGNLKSVPIGVTGELCISGAGLARGYLGCPELTAEKFVENPLRPGERMYRTGDLARWLPDGNIEFLGRIDHQVKIRGYRIELGEIEDVLRKHAGVKEAVVIARDDGSNNKYLCAYIVAESGLGAKELNVAELRNYLTRELPEYMVPSQFIQLEKIPLNKNGKIDRKLLIDSDRFSESGGNIGIGTEYEAPSNETEEKLAELWQEVLGIERIGINDNFFELGGHSLNATVMAARVHKEINVEIPLKEIFMARTIKGLGEYISRQKESKYEEIKKAEDRQSYPASSAQKRLYTLQQMATESTGYNMASAFELEGTMKTELLERSFKQLIIRHESLRTSFEMEGEEIVQKIHDNVVFNIEYFNAEDEEETRKIAGSFSCPFDLSEAPLFRAGLITVNPDKHILLFDMHHIISDGVSMGILIGDFVGLYMGKELRELRLQYKDYAVWQRNRLETGEIMRQEEYWLKEYAGDINILNLPTDYHRPGIQSFEGDSIRIEIGRELTGKLKVLAGENEATMYMLLLAGINILLSKYSGQQDIIIGSPIAGRTRADLENIMGMFVNTLAIRNYPEEGKIFREFLGEVKSKCLKAYENQEYQFEDLVDKVQVRRDISRNPIFDVMFVLQNMEKKVIKLEGLKLKPYEMENVTSKFDLTFSAEERKETIGLAVEYSTKLFSKETIERMGRHLVNILENAAEQPEAKLQEIEMMSAEERQQLLEAFNDTYSEYPREKTIHRLFEEQADKTPDNTAIVYEESAICNKTLTYRMLNEKANQLARVLKEKGVCPESAVGIMAERSPEMIIGILGILKAGGAYLPIDPEYPEDRIRYMLEDSGAKILLTNKESGGNLTCEIEKISLDEELLYEGDGNNLEHTGQADNLSYIMYTSGSTGKPKGVMVEHKSVVRLVKNTNYIEFEKNDRILQTSAAVFDVAIFEIWGALLNGLELYLTDKNELLDGTKLGERLEKYGITIMWLTSALFSYLAEGNADIFKKCKKLLAGGDVLSPKHINKVRSINKELIIINGYGPTENTTFSTCFRIDKTYKENIPIGKPVSNSKAYIMDSCGRLQPIGVAGELCVSGDGLARGYLNRPELTAEKFVENPFISGERMYRTGDLARWLPDGNIEFLGRMDYQVKIRGYRIEPGEIENELKRHEAVKEAAVIAKEDGSGKFLCAYIVVDRKLMAESEVTAAELRLHLSKKLPDYMIPSYFVMLEKLPLNQNGKIDRKVLLNSGNLPEMSISMHTGMEYEAPGNELEQKLAELWQEVLKVERVGINDNFFELGGHSLNAIVLAKKISAGFGGSNLMSNLFHYPTVKQYAGFLMQQDNKTSVRKEDNIILLRESADIQKNLFLVHDGSGEVFAYEAFAQVLNNDYNVWGIRADRKDRYESQKATISEIASEYVEKIRKIQPEGSYSIGGWCIGGTIAFEMARQLEKLHIKVDRLLLFDSPPPDEEIANDVLTVSNIFVDNVKIILGDVIAENDIETLNHTSNMNEIKAVFIKLIEEETINMDMIKSRIPANIAKAIPGFFSIEPDELLYYVNRINILTEARDSYIPQESSIMTETYFFAANENRIANIDNWSYFTGKPVKVYNVKGDHFTMWKSPNVEELGQAVITGIIHSNV